MLNNKKKRIMLKKEDTKNKKTTTNNNEKERGITLVALVITIVVLIILSTITIGAIFGDEGLINSAERAKELAEKAVKDENNKMNILMQEYANAMAEDGEITPPEVDNIPPIVSIVVGEITEDSIEVTVNATDNESGLATSGTYKYYLDGQEKATIESNSYTYTGLTAGTQYTIKVEAYDQAGNKGENSTTVSTNKPAIEAGDIIKKPTAFYGAEVKGYTCTSQGVSKWRIFYADENNIYLIADDYISYKYAPNGKNGTAITRNTDYQLSFDNVYKDYEGASWIKANSKGKKWLNEFLSAYGTSTYANIRAVAYMMDTNVWSIYSGEDAEYAIGGPTVEMYCASYKDTHPNKYIECGEVNQYGYKVKWNTDESYKDYINIDSLIQNDFNSIYIKLGNGKVYETTLASPSCGDYEGLISARGPDLGDLNQIYHDLSNGGLRPIVCLKSGIRLKEQNSGIYEIVK